MTGAWEKMNLGKLFEVDHFLGDVHFEEGGFELLVGFVEYEVAGGVLAFAVFIVGIGFVVAEAFLDVGFDFKSGVGRGDLPFSLDGLPHAGLLLDLRAKMEGEHFIVVSLPPQAGG